MRNNSSAILCLSKGLSTVSCKVNRNRGRGDAVPVRWTRYPGIKARCEIGRVRHGGTEGGESRRGREDEKELKKSKLSFSGCFVRHRLLKSARASPSKKRVLYTLSV